MKISLLLICTIIPLLAGCNSSQPLTPEKHQGRDETNKLEGASAVGYDGTAIRKSVDKTLNRNDDHNRNLDNQNGQLMLSRRTDQSSSRFEGKNYTSIQEGMWKIRR